MAELSMSFLKEKLTLFLGEEKAEETLEKVITSAGLVKKTSYSKEEAEKIVERLIAEGGFVEFVGRNIKASLILSK